MTRKSASEAYGRYGCSDTWTPLSLKVIGIDFLEFVYAEHGYADIVIHH